MPFTSKLGSSEARLANIIFAACPSLAFIMRGSIQLGGEADAFALNRAHTPKGGISIGGSAVVVVEAARCEVTVGSAPNTLPITKFRFPEAPLIPWEEPIFIECERDGELVCEEEVSLRFVLPPLNLRNPLYSGQGAYLPAHTICHQESFKEFDVRVSVDEVTMLSLLSFEDEIGEPPVEEIVQIQIIEEPKPKVLKDKLRKAKKVKNEIYLSNVTTPEPKVKDHYDPKMKMIFVRVIKEDQKEEIKPVVIDKRPKKLSIRKPKKAISSQLLKNIKETKVAETQVPTLSSSERLAMTRFPEKVLEERKRQEQPRVAAPVKGVKTRGRKARNSLFQANVSQVEIAKEKRRRPRAHENRNI